VSVEEREPDVIVDFVFDDGLLSPRSRTSPTAPP
jgi:hypothetical protein